MECTSARHISQTSHLAANDGGFSTSPSGRSRPVAHLLVFGQRSSQLQSRLQALGYETCRAGHTLEDSFIRILRDLPDLVLIDIDPENPSPDIALAERIQKFHDLALSYSSDGEVLWTVRRNSHVEPFSYVARPQDDLTLNACIQLCLLCNDPSSGHNGAQTLPPVLALI